MADNNNFSSGSNQGGSSIPPKPLNMGVKEGEAPLASPNDLKFDLRTMGSDVASVKDSGGGAPRPYIPPPPVPSREDARGASIPNARPPVPPGISFAPQNFNPLATTSPVQPKIMETPKTEVISQDKKSGKGLFYGLLTFIVILGIGALGYFVVYPMFIGEKNTNTETPVVEETPTLPEAPIEEAEEVVTPEEPTAITHASLFKIPADQSNVLSVSVALGANIFKNSIENETSAPALRELLLQKEGGAVFETPDLLGALFPSLSPSFSSLFEKDPTVFLYINQSGAYPGIVLKAKSGASLEDVKVSVAQIESSSDITNIFLTNPGANSGAWKAGVASGIQTRYVVLGNGLAFNYGWIGNVLLVSASYDGFKEAVRRLQ